MQLSIFHERVIENFARSVYPTLVKIRVQDATRVCSMNLRPAQAISDDDQRYAILQQHATRGSTDYLFDKFPQFRCG